MPLISGSKGYETRKHVQLKEMFFLKNHEENEVRRLVQDLIYSLYMRREQLGCSLGLIYFHSPQLGIQ